MRIKSIRTLNTLGIPAYEHLPEIEIGKAQRNEDVAKRIVILYALGVLLEGVDAKRVMKWLEEEDLTGSLSNKELDLLSGRKLTDIDKNELSWKQESLYVLCWAGGLVSDLDLPTGECDLTKIFPQIPRSVPVDSFICDYTLRESNELLQQLDIYYCIHFSLRHEELWEGRDFPKPIHPTVAVERRLALEWLSDEKQEWDCILLDT